jgi:hypothetical protein
LLKIQQNYLKKFENISFYFTQMVENQKSDIEIDGSFINIKGEENYVNILKKTVKSMKYIYENIDFDFLIRTNISTVINIELLKEFLINIPKEKYYGGHNETLNWFDIGITDYTHFGTKFVCGFNIILSKDMVKIICDNENKLNYNIIDDISIAIFIKENFPTILEQLTHDPCILFSNFFYCNHKFNFNYIFYRNRKYSQFLNENRTEDLIAIIILTDKFTPKKKYMVSSISMMNLFFKFDIEIDELNNYDNIKKIDLPFSDANIYFDNITLNI